MKSVVPSVLAITQEEFQEQLKKIDFRSEIHIDIADGVFVRTKTIGYQEVSSANIAKQMHVHLMVQNPESYVQEWLALPNLLSLTFHIESTDKTAEIINTIRVAGKFAGIAINPETSATVLEPFANTASFIQFMTVHPGRYGAEFQPSVVETIKDFHQRHPKTVLVADGGVNPERAPILTEAGIEILVCGSYIMKSQDPVKAVQEIETSIQI